MLKLSQTGGEKTGVIGLRLLAPMVIVISFLADVGLRFVPPDRIAFRAWEAVRLLRNADGPFAKNLVYDSNRSHGDLPNLGNLPSRRVFRSEHFTTDDFGFRNTPGAENRPVRIIVVGDSFTAGSGLSDSETLSAQLAEMSQNGVYNCGGDPNWRHVEKLIKRLHLNGGLVIWQISERYDPSSEVEDSVPFHIRIIRSLIPVDSPFYEKLGIVLYMAKGYSTYSPLQIIITRIFRGVQDDKWLPNVSSNEVLWTRLSNGKEMGFLPSEVTHFGIVRSGAPNFFVRLQASVRATGNELMVLMIPDKYNVYYPLLMGSPVRTAEEVTTLGTLAQRLKTSGVPALDLTPAFRQQAASELRNDRYLYLTDDTHWNPIGVRIAAEETLKFLRESGLRY